MWPVYVYLGYGEEPAIKAEFKHFIHALRFAKEQSELDKVVLTVLHVPKGNMYMYQDGEWQATAKLDYDLH